MSGKFVLKRSGTQFMFNLASAGNGEVVLTSERYTSKQSAQTGILAVQVNSLSDDRYQRLTSSNGKPFFVLAAANGQPIGTSELYSSVQARDAGIAWVKANAKTAPTVGGDHYSRLRQSR